MTTERIDIVVREDGSRVVRRNLEDIGTSARTGAAGVDRLQDSMRSMKALLATMGIGYGISEIVKYIDTWANLQGRLSLVTESYRQMKDVQNELFQVSQRTRSSLEGTVDLYTRITRNTKELNATDRERIKVTEAINKSIIISGSSSASAEAALVQLGQGFASGTLRGQELNSVLEQTPRLAEAIANGMGKTVGELRAMGAEGKLTSEAVFKALLQQSDALQSEFEKMPQTIGQTFEMLKNEVLKFVGTTGEANGVAGNFAATIAFVARNLDIIAAGIQGVVTYKLAEWFLGTAVAATRKYVALVNSTNALIAERGAAIAAAEAAVAQAGAELAVANATQAAILTSREEQVVRLAQANANIRAAQSSMAAAEAAGAQAFALRILRESTQQLALAEAERAAATAALATLGQQQARVSAQIAAATTAETAATTALAGARTAATGAAGLAGRAIGLLGGPIGIITTLLGIGATAWALWGNKAKTGEQEAQQAVEQTHEEIIGKINEQIKKLEERNRLAGVNPELAKDHSDQYVDSARKEQARALTEIDRITKDVNITDAVRTELLRVQGSRYNAATVALEKYTEKNEALNKTLNGSKIEQWLSKHEEYMSKTEQLAAAIKDAKKELGDAFTPEIERRITEAMGKKQGQHDVLLQYRESIEALKMQQKLQAEISKGQLDHAQAQYNQGGLSQTAFLTAQRDAQLEENTRMQEFVSKQLELTKGAGKEQIAARAQYNGELKVLEQQRANIMQAYNDNVEGIFAARKRQEIDAGNQELVALNQQNQGLLNKIQYFQMLPDAITRATIAELENQKAVLDGDFADQAKINSINAKIEALKRLAASQTASQQQDFDYNLAQQTADAWKHTGDVIANSLTTAFGKGGQALSKMVQGYTGFKKAEADLRKQYDDRVKVAAGDAKRIRDAEIAYSAESSQARISSYADMVGAAKGFFDEHSRGVQALQAAEQVFRAFEMAMAIKSMMLKIFATNATTTAAAAGNAAAATSATASASVQVAAAQAVGMANAAAGVANQAKGDPYSAWARMAAMAAVMAGLGFAVSVRGGSGVNTSAAEYVQKHQGTGSVFGDLEAQSESLSRAMGILEKNSSLMLPLTRGMLSSLRNIEASMSGLANIVLRTSGVTDGSTFDVAPGQLSAGPGGLVGKFLNGVTQALLGPGLGGKVASLINNLWGKTTQDITDSGIQFGGRVGDLQAGSGFNQYANVTTTKSSWFGLSKSTSNQLLTSNLNEELTSQFGLVFKNLETVLRSAATGLGMNADAVGQAVQNVNVDLTKLSLKGLSGDELTKAITAVISKASDDVAMAVIPGFQEFRKVGEGYTETIVRVASGIERAKYETEQLGIACVSYTDILNKQGDVTLEMIRQSLLAKESTSGLGEMIAQFSGSADDLISSYKDLIDIRRIFNNTGLNGNNLSTGTLRGAGGLDKLSEGAKSFFDNFFTDAEKHAAALANLTIEFSKLGLSLPKSKDEFRALILQMDDGTEAGNKLVGQLLALSGAVSDLYGSSKNAAELASSRRSLEIKVMELSGRKAEALAASRKDELDAMDESLRGLQKQVYALQDLEDARNNLEGAYSDEASRLTDLRDKFRDLGKSISEFMVQLQLGDNSNLDPLGKYKAARDQFNSVYAKAKTGDADALGQLQQAAQDFLTASKDYNATGAQYGSDYKLVMDALGNSMNVANRQADIAQQQLNSINQMVSGIVDLKTTTQKFYDAFTAYATAKMAAASAGVGGGGGGGGGGSGSSLGSAASAYTSAFNSAVGAYGAQYGNNAYYFVKGINDYEAKKESVETTGKQLGWGWEELTGHSEAYWKEVQRQWDNGMHPTETSVTGFALGGAFTNGIVTEPTMFNMAQMGERGAEAIMPLTRMPDGSLGVRIVGQGGSTDDKAIAVLIEKLDALLIELAAANTQRGAGTTANLERLAQLEEEISGLRRTMERA